MNIDRFDARAENWLDKMERGSKWLAWLCCAIVLYFVVRGIWG